MCLAIAYLSEKSTSFVLGENRDDEVLRVHEENHITNVEAWPEVAEGKTWIGMARNGVSHRCVALLNYYPEEENWTLKGSRGFVVPQMLQMDEPRLEDVENLENIAPFQTLTYRKELHQLVWEIWDGKNIQRQELEPGIHVLASSSYEVSEERIARARELIGARASLTADEISEILATTDTGNIRTTTTPCMRGEWSETIGSHVIESDRETISIRGFSGSPADPDSQFAEIDTTLRM